MGEVVDGAKGRTERLVGKRIPNWGPEGRRDEVQNPKCNSSVYSDFSLEEASEAGERLDSGPGARTVAESL